ncbi:hypothetical protein [Paraburkholderia caribensis]|uniref:hypothetical protein n=1 Tax=Paraburkholderia caribensis TaxID=75105 RepID=UPI002866A6D8|nr:hypothetical protein [Paraburkholderia caribensis]
MTAPRCTRLRIAIFGRQLAFHRRFDSSLAAADAKTHLALAFAPCLCATLDIFRRETVFDHQFPDLVQRTLRALSNERFGL